jgi:Ca2+-binding EF-hand superfamily protein
MNYERVRDLLNRLDICHNGRISANEIRSIVEDLIEYPLKADEYYQLLKQIPMDENGRVIYKEYLKEVLDRTLYFQEQQQKSSKYLFLFYFSLRKNFYS